MQTLASSLPFRCTLLACVICATVSDAQPPDISESSTWQLESVTRSDGKQFLGLIANSFDDYIEFVEIVRPPGRPMYLVVHHFPKNTLKETETLPKSQREKLLARVQPLLTHKRKSSVEAGRMEDIGLEKRTIHGQPFFIYEGPWLTLQSAADEESTRRCAVRIDQIFDAYRQLLPPHIQPASPSENSDKDDAAQPPLRLILYGTRDDYMADLRRRGLDIENPAFYSPGQNLVVAGGDLSSYAGWLAESRADNRAARIEFERLNKEFNRRIAQLRDELQTAGFPPAEIRFEMNARRGAWEREKAAAAAKITRFERHNEAKFADVTKLMFRRIYHEAFHAYLQNYVYPADTHETPRWLNEGLAQMFESGQLEGGALRVDSPPPEFLQWLREDLQADPIPLAELFHAADAAFLVNHRADVASKRHYLYSWGVAYYLTFERNLLQSDAMENYVSKKAARLSPIDRFEELVGEKLPDFEAKWRRAMTK